MTITIESIQPTIKIICYTIYRLGYPDLPGYLLMANLKTKNRLLIINAMWFIENNKRAVDFYLYDGLYNM